MRAVLLRIVCDYSHHTSHPQRESSREAAEEGVLDSLTTHVKTQEHASPGLSWEHIEGAAQREPESARAQAQRLNVSYGRPNCASVRNDRGGLARRVEHPLTTGWRAVQRCPKVPFCLIRELLMELLVNAQGPEAARGTSDPAPRAAGKGRHLD